MTPEERADKIMSEAAANHLGWYVQRQLTVAAIRAASAETHRRCLEAAEKTMRAQVHIEEEMGAQAVVDALRALTP